MRMKKHRENAVLFAYHEVIKEAEKDFSEILSDTSGYENEKIPLPLRLIGSVIELFAPLF